MSEEIGLIYLNLSQLLDEICVFLREGVNKEVFSAESQKQAEMLIKRSKIQLQQISNITNGECYMQMDEHKTVEDDNVEDEDDLIYMDAEEEKETKVEFNDVCPFADSTAKDLPLDDKAGYIYMKTKFIFGFEKLKRIYAAIYKDWFLIYCNDKDSKPCNIYCLRTHKAQMILTTKHGQNETQLFALINQETNQKWQFLAQTHKDMLQWITRINRYHQDNGRQPNKTESAPKLDSDKEMNEQHSEDEGELYDSVIIKVENEKKVVDSEENEEIYEVIGPQNTDKIPHIPIAKLSDVPSIPTRRQQTPLPPLPVDKTASSESLVSYDNPVSMEKWENQSNISETPSFSEDEEQEIYDVLVTAATTKDREDRRDSTNLPEVAPLISSLQEKLLQTVSVKEPERPIPPKKLVYNSNGSPTKGNPKASSPLRNSLIFSTFDNSPTSLNSKYSFSKPHAQPKPTILAKPKIDVKIIKPSMNTKSSTKQVMKLAKEISFK